MQKSLDTLTSADLARRRICISMIDIFAEEYKLIKSPSVKRLVWNCFEAAPEYFWKVPSSNTGRYHPKDEFVDGGLVLHTKRAVRVAMHLCEALSIMGLEKDCVIAAALMHDLCKNGMPENSGHTVDGHGFLWIELARSRMPKNQFTKNHVYRTISRLILYHMGKFDTPYILDWSDTLATCVYLADYIASRRDVLVNVEEVPNEEVPIRDDRKRCTDKCTV